MPRALSVREPVPADVEAAFALLTGPAWPAALDARLHDGSERVRDEPAPGGGRVVVLRRRLPDAVPGPLRSLAPADGRVEQTDTWGPPQDGARHATWSATFPGSPARVGGGMSLLPDPPGGCTWSVEGSVEVRVPVVGGRIERYLAPLIEQLVAAQADVLRASLA